MLSRKVKSRIFFLFFLSILAVAIIFFTLKSLEENVVYFLTPTEVHNKTDISFKKKIRVGGLVKINSVNKKEIIVSYIGLVPNLFAEGKGVVAEGKLKDKKYFVADKILAKHDENYMPPEVSEALEKSKN